MFGKKIICFSLMILIIMIGAVSASENITIENDLQAHETTNTFDDVQNTIEKAKFNSTVILNGTYKGSGHEIEIDKDITIDGLGKTTLNANHNSRIFNINSSNVILKNLNITNGFSSVYGGAITSSGKLTIINCNFINNNVYDTFNYLSWREPGYGEGGAIYTENDLTVINSTFIDNYAKYLGSYHDMDVDVDMGDYGNGGAISCLGNLYLENSNFTKNSLHSIMAHYNASILNCIFKSSSIYCSETADLHIRNCDFKDAKINSGNLTVNNSNFIGIKHGDALIYSEHAKIINSTFINNTASNTAILILEDYELKDCVFINNRDATILSGDSLLNDSLMPTYLKAKSMNHLRKTYYKSGKSLKIDSIYEVKIYINGKKHELYEFYDYNSKFYDYNSNYFIFPVSTWKVGTYTIFMKSEVKYVKDATFKITVLKAPTTVKAPKVIAKYKKSKYFKVTVKHKTTKKAVKNTYIKLKIGKKTYKVKTNSKGIAKFNTKKLKVGTHKVTITSGNANYKISAKSQIKVKK